MASGTLQVRVLSRDYPYNAGTDSPKGHFTNVYNINWSVDESNRLHLSYGGQASGSTFWYVINTGTTCRVWFNGQVVASSNKSPVNSDHVHDLLAHLIGKLPPIQLTTGGQLKISFGSDLPPAPTPSLPNAFPSHVMTEGDQVPVIIPDPDYRPGARYAGGAWHSHNRGGGKCEIKKGGWHEMRTMDGGSGNDNHPTVRRGGVWKNQRKIGNE